MTCQTCLQLIEDNDNLDGVYCSVVCKGLVNKSAVIMTGSYWGINSQNQSAEVKRR